MSDAQATADLVRQSILGRVLGNIKSRAREGVQWIARDYYTDVVREDLEAMGYSFGETQVVWGIGPSKASAEIAALQAEINAVRKTLMAAGIALHVAKRKAEAAEAALTAERAKVAALVEAIRPYADFAKDRAVDAPEWTDKDHIQVLISIGDLRALASAIATCETAKGESHE